MVQKFSGIDTWSYTEQMLVNGQWSHRIQPLFTAALVLGDENSENNDEGMSTRLYYCQIKP